MNLRCALAAAALASLSCSHARHAARVPEVIVLGMDGMDPNFLERHWSDLPNLNHLRTTGAFRRLETVMPPQSPVAWATFITGVNPAGHGIFDFVHRRAGSREPYSSMSAVAAPVHQFAIGPYLIPLSPGRIQNHRRGAPFWQMLTDRAIPVTVLRMPVDFPPSGGEDNDDELSGMGTPDMRGTFGTFTYFTDAPGVVEHDVTGGRVVPVTVTDDRAILHILGPPNTLRRDRADTAADLTVEVDAESPAARFRAGSTHFVLAEGQWSDWIHVRFPLIAGLYSQAGMFRVYVRQLHPAFQIYVSPVNLDPEDPALPIANPPAFSAQLARAEGAFYTQGMAQDTAALRDGVFTVDEYLAQSRLVSQEHLRLLHYAVEHCTEGLIFFHFFAIDQDSHMLWGKYDSKLLATYRMADHEIGWVREHAPDALLLVLSDHGFSRFDYAVNLNRWLADHGYLALRDSAGSDGLENVDWSHTRTYAMGLNGLYLNLAGRERGGIVKPQEVDGLLAEIQRELRELRNPGNGEPVVEAVYRTRDLYPGSPPDTAPDLLIGYRPGYRASWETALGGTPVTEVLPNNDAWIADHCIDPRFVPGVLLSNRSNLVLTPALADVTVSILQEYGIQPPLSMNGRSIFAPAAALSHLGEIHVRKQP